MDVELHIWKQAFFLDFVTSHAHTSYTHLQLLYYYTGNSPKKTRYSILCIQWLSKMLSRTINTTCKFSNADLLRVQPRARVVCVFAALVLPHWNFSIETILKSQFSTKSNIYNEYEAGCWEVSRVRRSCAHLLRFYHHTEDCQWKKFSKVNLLPNLLYTMNAKLTFENLAASSAHVRIRSYCHSYCCTEDSQKFIRY